MRLDSLSCSCQLLFWILAGVANRELVDRSALVHVHFAVVEGHACPPVRHQLRHRARPSVRMVNASSKPVSKGDFWLIRGLTA